MKQVISKERVTNHGEVYTADREVNAMLDLVNDECQRIESKFLEPACGSGNFLVEILSRKLKTISSRYSRSQIEYERNSILALGSIYGIDLLPDNVEECRHRLLSLFKANYLSHFANSFKEKYLDSARYILEKNILHGDALTLKTVSSDSVHSKPIVFSDWSLIDSSMIKRRDYIFEHLVDQASHREMPLFSDMDEEAYIPEPIKDYPLRHYTELISDE